MKKLLLVSALSFALVSPALAGKPIFIFHHIHHIPKPPPVVKPPASSPSPQAASPHGFGPAPWIVGGIIGCQAVSLIGYSAYIGRTQHRELTCKEAWTTAAWCIGLGWAVEQGLTPDCKFR
jgi:hypothetical protein